MSQTASEMTADVRSGKTNARALILDALHRIEKLNPALNAFTDVLTNRALQRADAIDQRIAAGKATGPLAGVPFAVKNRAQKSTGRTSPRQKMQRWFHVSKQRVPFSSAA
jgi:Asp-tRNA(Asn)/Glu-tRNA(Gln) amidotransferase A subunit family amidase